MPQKAREIEKWEFRDKTSDKQPMKHLLPEELTRKKYLEALRKNVYGILL